MYTGVSPAIRIVPSLASLAEEMVLAVSAPATPGAIITASNAPTATAAASRPADQRFADTPCRSVCMSHVPSFGATGTTAERANGIGSSHGPAGSMVDELCRARDHPARARRPRRRLV